MLFKPTQQNSRVKGGRAAFQDRRETENYCPGGRRSYSEAGLRLRARGSPGPVPILGGAFVGVTCPQDSSRLNKPHLYPNSALQGGACNSRGTQDGFRGSRASRTPSLWPSLVSSQPQATDSIGGASTSVTPVVLQPPQEQGLGRSLWQAVDLARFYWFCLCSTTYLYGRTPSF